VEVAEDIEAVIDADYDDVAAPRQIGAVGDRTVGRAEMKSAAMQPHHDRALGIIEARRPDMQGQAVLGFRARVYRAEKSRHSGAASRRRLPLRRASAIGQRVAQPGPGLGRPRRHEAVRADRRRGIGNALERTDPGLRAAAQFAGGGLDDRLHGHFHPFQRKAG